MAKSLVLALALLALTTLICGPAFAGKKKAEEIKALEEQIRQLDDQEKEVLKRIDARYDHIIRYLDPKEVHSQLEDILEVLGGLNDLLSLHDNGSADHLNYNGFRHKAHESIERAAHHVEEALKHDTADERREAAENLGAVQEDISKALAFSEEHPGAVDGTDKKELERRAVENQHLTEALPKIEMAHHLLVAVDHEIRDYKAEKAELHNKREAEKKETREQFEAARKELEEQVKALKK